MSDRSYIYLKWSPSINETYDKSLKTDKKKCIKNDVTNLVLMESDEFNFGKNKKEFSNSKINERELIKQISMNPFLATDYLEDIKNVLLIGSSIVIKHKVDTDSYGNPRFKNFSYDFVYTQSAINIFNSICHKMNQDFVTSNDYLFQL